MGIPAFVRAGLASAVWAMAAIAPVQAGVIATWPSAGCDATLQECVNAAGPDAIVRIATNTPIDENLVFTSHGVALEPAAGFKPRFAPGRGILGSFATPSGTTLRIRGIAFTDAGVGFSCYSGGTATVELADLSIVRAGGLFPGRLAVNASAGCSINATVTDNRVHSQSDGIGGVIHLGASGSALNAYVAYNRVTGHADGGDAGGGIFVDVTHSLNPGNGHVRLFANTVAGRFGRGSIVVSEGQSSSAASTLTAVLVNNVAICTADASAGISLLARHGNLDTQTVNNTVSGCARGVLALLWEDGSIGARIDGAVANNLISAATQGLTFNTAITPALVNDYNLINAPSLANVSLGSGTLSAPAQLVANRAPRLRAGSPAINAANGMLLANLLVEYGLPATDGDGLRRVKGPSADIGAYEWGDFSHGHTARADNTFDHITFIDHPASNGNIGASVFGTRRWQGTTSVAPYGVYYDGSDGAWALYHDDFSGILPGVAWSIWLPAAGSGVFTHQANAGNSTGWWTRIDHSSSNGQPGRILLATHNWTAIPTYNPHNIGVFYSGAGVAGRWHVANVGQGNLPASGSAFNIYSQPPSPNAFRLEAPAGEFTATIDHPLVNGEDCARIHVTRVVPAGNPGDSNGFDLEFSSTTGQWLIYSPSAFPAGTAFHIVIDPAQVFDCTDRIFADGFE